MTYNVLMGTLNSYSLTHSLHYLVKGRCQATTDDVKQMTCLTINNNFDLTQIDLCSITVQKITVIRRRLQSNFVVTKALVQRMKTKRKSAKKKLKKSLKTRILRKK